MQEVQAYAFGRGQQQAPFTLSGLDRLGEKLGRQIRILMEPIAGVRPHVTADQNRIISFGEWSSQLSENVSISMYRLHPLKGQMMLRMDGAMISTLVDCFYGGLGNRPLLPRSEFSPTEDRLIARIADAIMSRLVESWSEMQSLDPVLVVRENGVGFAAGAQPDDQMVLQRFHFSITRQQEWPIDLVLPLSALLSVEGLLGPGETVEEPQRFDPEWQEAIARRMRDIRLPARTVLARPHLSLAELMELRVGDVIPVTIGRSLPLIIGDRIVAHGSIGEQDGRSAFQIEKLIQESQE